MSSSIRREQERHEYSNTQQHEAAIRSIDETKEEMRREIEQVRRETPRYSQIISDFQNETADASMEIADNFLESQKEVINSLQSAWAPMAERMEGDQSTGMMGMPFFSPRQIADIYARTIGAMTEAYVASTRMATNMLFTGIEAVRATTNYVRQNAKEAAHITSNTARTFAPTVKETVQVQEEARGGEIVGTARARGSSSFGAGGEGAGTITTTTAYTSEGTMASSSGTGSATTTGTGSTLSDTVPGVADKTRKK